MGWPHGKARVYRFVLHIPGFEIVRNDLQAIYKEISQVSHYVSKQMFDGSEGSSKHIDLWIETLRNTGHFVG